MDSPDIYHVFIINIVPWEQQRNTRTEFSLLNVKVLRGSQWEHTGMGMQLRGTVFAQHVQRSGFNP